MPCRLPQTLQPERVLETHISTLFFTADRVYKAKKAVRMAFLDFSTLALRRAACRAELRLNQRLVEGVHLGLVAIERLEGGGIRIGEAVEDDGAEWAVEMVRLPEQRMLSALLDRGEIDNAQMNAVVRLLVDFHARVPTGAGVDEFGSPAAVRELVEGNRGELAALVSSGAPGLCPPALAPSPVQLRFLGQRLRAACERLEPLLARRVDQGRIREGHGDLHADNLCLTEAGVLAYDCIEFSRAFRCADVAADLAFLAMDLDLRGYAGFSRYLVRRYALAASDPELERLVPFYKVHRALVRAKVAWITASDEDRRPEAREAQRRAAQRFVQLAVGYELPPALVLVCGPPGSGKTGLAGRLALPLRAAHLQEHARRRPPGALLASACRRLRAGRTVVVDAELGCPADRSRYVDAAARMELPYCVVRASGDPRRISTGRASGSFPGSSSGAAVESPAFEPPDEIPPAHRVDAQVGGGAPEDQAAAVLDRLVELGS